MEKLIKRLRDTAARRTTATAQEENQYLMVVARLSREDAALMVEAADAIECLLAFDYEKEYLDHNPDLI